MKYRHDMIEQRLFQLKDWANFAQAYFCKLFHT